MIFGMRYLFEYRKKHYEKCIYLGLFSVGGEVGGVISKKWVFVIVLLGGGNHRMLALLWILIFDFYMILCHHPIPITYFVMFCVELEFISFLNLSSCYPINNIVLVNTKKEQE